MFVAVDVDRATRDAAERLRTRLTSSRPTLDRALRWVEPDTLHLTLRFLGEREDVGAIERALAPPFAERRFSISWAAPGWLPPHGRPRVLYVAVGDGAEALARVAEEVTTRLQPLGIQPDVRAFTAHLTLARVRDRLEPVLLRQLMAATSASTFAADVRVTVDAVVLYESRLSPQGPTYRAQCRSRLSGS
jgi:2'-5' RNA ligase